MFVHVDSAFFEQRPRLTIFVCLVALAGYFWLITTMYSEYRDFGDKPAVVDLATVPGPPQNHGRWITPQQPLEFACAPVKKMTDWPESWVFGKVDATYIQVSVSHSRIIVLHAKGDISCLAMALRAQRGVLETMNPTMRQNLGASGLDLPPEKEVLKYCVTCGPQESRKMMLLSLFFPAIVLFTIYRMTRKYLDGRRLREMAIPEMRSW